MKAAPLSHTKPKLESSGVFFVVRKTEILETVLLALTAVFLIRRRRTLFELLVLIIGHCCMFGWMKKDESV